jgi:Arc/MetJ-type ribon-helix-helix transcriptional regulator
MKKQDARTALRLPKKQRQKIDQLVHAGEYKNLSDVIRTALEQFFNRQALP